MLSVAVAQLVLEYVKVLVWPFVVLILVVNLRNRLPTLVDRVTSVEAFGANVTFSESVGKASEALHQIRATHIRERIVEVVTPRSEVAEAAKRVLALYGIWPRFYRSSESVLVQLRHAWGQLDELTRNIALEFKAIDPLISRMAGPDRVFERLADITGLQPFRSMGVAVRGLHPDLLGRQNESLWGVMAESFSLLGMSVFGASFREIRIRRLADKYIDVIDEVMVTTRSLLEATAEAHGGQTGDPETIGAEVSLE